MSKIKPNILTPPNPVGIDTVISQLQTAIAAATYTDENGDPANWFDEGLILPLVIVIKKQRSQLYIGLKTIIVRLSPTTIGGPSRSFTRRTRPRLNLKSVTRILLTWLSGSIKIDLPGTRITRSGSTSLRRFSIS
jgi:hypothetical protein